MKTTTFPERLLEHYARRKKQLRILELHRRRIAAELVLLERLQDEYAQQGKAYPALYHALDDVVSDTGRTT